ncbi:MAG: aminodeoxychorismate synthase component I [Comamonadaceae bacterium]|nr:aminodeoxychorismate synthase component I [Comamonadaceae bacterium]
MAGLRCNIQKPGFLAAVERIRRYIAAGDCYQVNFTYALDFDHYGAPLALYAKLRRRQPVRYGAFVQGKGQAILSLSPELFVERAGERLTSRPMKGTAPRGRTPQEDAAHAATLAASAKDRAENVMIVDLIRNDLGRLGPPGSVRVERLFEVEAYPTVFQMVSTVTATLPRRPLIDIFRALFPCGSITGAPKIRAMQIIRELEREARGLYTGALGYVAPDGDFTFNVAIRTLVLDAEGHGRLGLGSGIVYDSDPANGIRGVPLERPVPHRPRRRLPADRIAAARSGVPVAIPVSRRSPAPARRLGPLFRLPMRPRCDTAATAGARPGPGGGTAVQDAPAAVQGRGVPPRALALAGGGRQRTADGRAVGATGRFPRSAALPQDHGAHLVRRGARPHRRHSRMFRRAVLQRTRRAVRGRAQQPLPGHRRRAAYAAGFGGAAERRDAAAGSGAAGPAGAGDDALSPRSAAGRRRLCVERGARPAARRLARRSPIPSGMAQAGSQPRIESAATGRGRRACARVPSGSACADGSTWA